MPKNLGVAASPYDGQYYSKEHNHGNATATTTIDWNNGNCQKVDMVANITTLNLNSGAAGSRYMLRLVQDSTGGRTVSWPSSVKWAGGTVPTLSGANKTDLVAFYFTGVDYLGAASLNYS